MEGKFSTNGGNSARSEKANSSVADYLGRYLNEEEIHALNTRRELIVRIIQKLIEVAGEANVLF